ncbi:MAG: hypothetical protein EA355_15655 [Rhodobacteraceae bacterium]|nr:MAG: hypothetical protein EA355_15655 [Paracoccaceae bacterium]
MSEKRFAALIIADGEEKALADTVAAFATDERTLCSGPARLVAQFPDPPAALRAARAARRADLRLGLAFGALERGVVDCEPVHLAAPEGAVAATAAFASAAAGLGAFAYVGPWRPPGATRAFDAFLLREGPDAAAAAARLRPARRPAPDGALLVAAFRREGPSPPPPWLAAALAGDLAARLARAARLPVLSRAAAAALAGDGASATEAAAMLGARFVIEGAIRSDGRAVGATARLIDVETSREIWGGWRRSEAAGLDLADALADGLAVALNRAAAPLREAARSATPLRALTLQAEALLAEGDAEAAAPRFEAAIALDERCARAQAGLALARLAAWRAGRAGPAALEEARWRGARAAALAPGDARARLAEGEALRLSGHPQAEAALAAALDANPCETEAMIALARARSAAGDAAGARDLVARAQALDPFFPDDWLTAEAAAWWTEAPDRAALALGRMTAPGAANLALAAALAAAGDGVAADRAAAAAPTGVAAAHVALCLGLPATALAQMAAIRAAAG